MFNILYRYLFLVNIFTLFFGRILCGSTIEQYMDAGRMMRNICEPKFKLTQELIAKLEAKETPDDKSLKCYINCIFEMTKAIKRGKYQLDTALKQVDMMVPDHMKEEYKHGMTSCKDAGKGIKDSCEFSYEIYKCLLAEVPSFIIP